MTDTPSADYEDLWVDGWTDLNFLIDQHRISHLLLPDHSEISLVDAKKWIQDAAREGEKLHLNLVFYDHKDCILMKTEKV